MEPQVVTTVVDFSPIIEIGVAIVTAVLSALVGIGFQMLNKRLKLEKDDQLTAALENITQRAISLSANRLIEQGKNIARVDVKDEMVAMAAKYIIASAPESVKRFELEDRIVDYVEARMVERIDIPTSHTVATVTEMTMPAVTTPVITPMPAEEIKQ